jgi:type IV secretory pathway VirB3-like protein
MLSIVMMNRYMLVQDMVVLFCLVVPATVDGDEYMYSTYLYRSCTQRLGRHQENYLYGPSTYSVRNLERIRDDHVCIDFRVVY